MNEPQQPPAPFVYAYEVKTFRDNRNLVVEERTFTAGIQPRGFNRFEGTAIIGIDQPTPMGPRTVPHQIRVAMPGVESVAEAFARFHEFMDPAAKSYVGELQRAMAEEQTRIVRPPARFGGPGKRP